MNVKKTKSSKKIVLKITMSMTKRDPSQHSTQEHEGSQWTSSPGVHARHDRTRVTTPAHEKCLPASGSRVNHKSPSQSTRGSSAKKQQRKISSSRKSSGTILDDSSDR